MPTGTENALNGRFALTRMKYLRRAPPDDSRTQAYPRRQLPLDPCGGLGHHRKLQRRIERLDRHAASGAQSLSAVFALLQSPLPLASVHE